ncbi:MAG: porin [Betaproteobacteria bacterium]|nr:porin [Betaproteobacteria bacterium]
MKPIRRLVHGGAAACCAGCLCCASAQAQEDSTLQLYGSIDVSAARFSGVRQHSRDPDAPPVATSLTGMGAGGVTGSRLGLRGSSALLPGLRLDFKAETGFCGVGLNQLDSGGDPYCSGGGFMQRESWLGLSGRLGSLRMGRQVTLVNQHLGQGDAFDNAYLGQVGNLSLVGNNRIGADMGRASQALSWISPEAGGFGLQAQYSPHARGARAWNDPDDARDPAALLVGAQYRVGAWRLGADWARWQHARAASGPSLGDTYQLWTAHAGLSLGPLDLFLHGEQGSADGANGDQRVLNLGLRLPLGQGKLMASVGRYADSMAPRPTRLQTSHATQYALGYSHALSPRTQLYLSAAHIVNEGATPARLGTDLAVGAAGDVVHGIIGHNSNGVALGLSHSF